MEIVIVGGGPGGYAAAIRCAQAGGRVTLVEAADLGGTCLNRGCIPTKSMAESARLYREARRMASWGVRAEGVSLDFAAVASRRRQVVAALVGGLGVLLKASGVRVVRGRGRLVRGGAVGGPAGCSVQVEGPDGGVYGGDAIVLAPGSVPALPPIPGVDLPGVMTSDALLQLERLPGSLCVIGGGVIGCEFASIFASFGTQVTVLEMMPQLLPAADGEVARRLAAAFRRTGIAVHTGVRVSAIQPAAGGLRVTWEGGSAEAEVVLVAVGRRPNTDGLGCDEVGVRRERGAIVVDEGMRTTVPGVFAVGDAVGGPMLAHAAFAQADVAARVIAGRPAAWDGRLVPSPVFAYPEVAWAGLSEEAAAAQGIPVRVGRFPFAASGRAQVAGETEGFAKVVAEAGSGRILGVHVIGPSATELVAEGVLAARAGLSAEDLEGAIHGHPTLSEALAEAAGAVLGRPLHVARR